MEGTAVERTSGIAGEQSLAERVNAYILTQHSSIHAVAKEVGYSRTSVSRYLSGKYDSCAASDTRSPNSSSSAAYASQILAPLLTSYTYIRLTSPASQRMFTHLPT